MLGTYHLKNSFSKTRTGTPSDTTTPVGHLRSKLTEEEKILAFRMIMTMLSWVQKHSLKYNSPRSITDDENQGLKILNALVTVLIIEREVVTVIADPGYGDAAKPLELLMCTQSTDLEDKHHLSSPGVINQIWRLLVNKNLCDNTWVSYDSPTIIELECSLNLTDDSQDALKEYLHARQ